jgi:hypothetical protein
MVLVDSAYWDFGKNEVRLSREPYFSTEHIFQGCYLVVLFIRGFKVVPVLPGSRTIVIYMGQSPKGLYFPTKPPKRIHSCRGAADVKDQAPGNISKTCNCSVTRLPVKDTQENAKLSNKKSQ